MSSPGYREIQQLIIRDTAFNEHNMARVVITGQSMGETWVLRVSSKNHPQEGGLWMGQIETSSAPGRPDIALDVARGWIESYCRWNRLEIETFHGSSDGPYEVKAELAIRRTS